MAWELSEYVAVFFLFCIFFYQLNEDMPVMIPPLAANGVKWSICAGLHPIVIISKVWLSLKCGSAAGKRVTKREKGVWISLLGLWKHLDYLTRWYRASLIWLVGRCLCYIWIFKSYCISKLFAWKYICYKSCVLCIIFYIDGELISIQSFKSQQLAT